MAAGVETSAGQHPLLFDGELPRACKVREPSIFAGDRHKVSNWLEDMKEYCQGIGVSESRWLFISKSYLSKTLKKWVHRKQKSATPFRSFQDFAEALKKRYINPLEQDHCRDALEELQYLKAQGMESFGDAFLDLVEEIKDTLTPVDLIHIFKKAIPDAICLEVNNKAPSTLEEAVEAACIAVETLEGRGGNRKRHVQTGGSRPNRKHQGQEGDQVAGEGEEEFWFPDNELSMNIEGEQPTDSYVYGQANMIGPASADGKVKTIRFQSTVEGIPVRVLLDCGVRETFLSAQFAHDKGLPIRKMQSSRQCRGAIKGEDGQMVVTTVSEYTSPLAFSIQGYHQRMKFTLANLDDDYDVYLGMKWLIEHELRVHWGKGEVEIPILGAHGRLEISDVGVRAELKKAELVQTWPKPENKHELHVFLGLCNWFWRFIYKYSHVTAPLTSLLQTKVEFVWSEVCEAAFKELKEKIAELILLFIPDPTRPFDLYVDMSEKEIYIAAALMQWDPRVNGLRVVALAFRKLVQTEQKYLIREKELLAVVFGVKTFCIYVNYTTKVYSDHESLKWLGTSRGLIEGPDRVKRWAIFLNAWSIVPQYIPGSKNVVADALSRRPSRTRTQKQTGEERFDKKERDRIAQVESTRKVCPDAKFLDQVRKGYAQDSFFKELLSFFTHAPTQGTPPAYLRLRLSHFSVKEGLLYYD
uniref:Reverse transcriptase/retrotransposon-derived protein RNase H-like domain-containing protein n=1 Tax=Chromera velia CCMP2878 TaxID=1169474 RepID=A0A0G4FTH2_9ALVE|eukprot:Cvel_18700.t1-p1 / transcript=Cvel_18700.t1 / gene=Cvel_18700 / organism=Chromera_velia_CCMP2878 / gene_product=Retrovirus-related Pol polyprotein from transposon, putative / transcript_product=Retrovirus-related Pol polyprotein from transposon, putative / location=Cvel_scaffold1566:18795-22343(-) / protein_length=696 / sequence_SO=supercontig / SO=protein_coding / is_pseudo=false